VSWVLLLYPASRTVLLPVVNEVVHGSTGDAADYAVP
jgi:hypothetical protein